jgi:homoserine kinase
MNSPRRFLAPATIANLGAGFDCAGVAFDLWNELELRPGSGVEVEGEEADSLPRDREHLSLQAFSLLADPDSFSFSFVNRIPIARGLGSSAAAIALGLVAGAAVSGAQPNVHELLALGSSLEGHADNLAPALAGGVCLTWEHFGIRQWKKVADRLPLVPVVVIPPERVETAAARASLPDTIPHEDAAFSAARASLLGAALASYDGQLLAAALADRLHEPYRAVHARLLLDLRTDPLPGAAGFTLAGSGPSVIAWTDPTQAATCSSVLRSRFPGADVRVLEVARTGAVAQALATLEAA